LVRFFVDKQRNEQMNHIKLSLSVDEQPNAHLNCLTLFSLTPQAQRKKLCKKETPFSQGLRPCWF